MNKQTLISMVALLAAPALLIGNLRGSNVFSNSPEPATTQAEPQAAPLADASADAPADVTLWVQNPKMDQAVNDGNWFNTGGGWATAYTGWNFRICNLPAANKGEAATSTMAERWVSGGLPTGDALYQELTGLPNGKYQLRAAALADPNVGPCMHSLALEIRWSDSLTHGNRPPQPHPSARNSKKPRTRQGLFCNGGKYGARTRDLRRDRPAL